MEIKKILNFDDAKFAVFDEEAERINVGLADSQGKLFNAMAKELDITPLRLLREAIAFFIDAYSIEPETFIEASKRAHSRAAEAMQLAATAIRARAQLAALEEREGDKLYKPENAVWCEIRDRIKEGNARKDKMLAWIANRPPVYRETFDGMMARGELTAERDGKKYILRFTTPQERESKKASGPSVWDGSTEKGKEYRECSQEEKEKRVLAYIAKYEQDNPIVKGQRDNNLRQLRGRLGHAGMTDDIAEQVFTQKALESGLTARDAARLWRQGGLNE